MMKHRKWHVLFLLLTFLIFSTGCPYYNTKKMFVVLYNDTNVPVEYAFFYFERWDKSVRLDPGKNDYVFDYEQGNPQEPLMIQLQKVKFNTGKCSITLDRSEMEKNFKRNPEGRATWDLRITEKFLSEMGCKS